MAEVTGVSIDVDLGISKALSKIASLKGSLKTLEDDLDLGVDLKLNDDGLSDIREDLNNADFKAKLSPEVGDLEGVKKDLKDATRSDDGSSNLSPLGGHEGQERRIGLPDGPRDASMNFGTTDTDIKDILKSRDIDINPDFNLDGLRLGDKGRASPAPLIGGGRGGGGDGGGGSHFPIGDIRGIARRRGGGDDDGADIGKGLMSLLPTRMSKWYNVLALMMPLLIAMAGAVAGVASAMIGAAGAGAALIGLGLIGHGEDIGEAFSNAREQVSQLGSELFNVMQNPAKKFAPIQERIFDMIPGEMTSVAESMEGLTVFEGLITTGIKGLIGWFAALVDMIVANEQAITNVSTKFGNLLGHGVINFLKYFINEANESQNALIIFGHALKTILLIIFNLSKTLSGLLVAFQPVFDFVLWFAQLLNNKLVMSVISAIAVFTILMGVMVKLNALMIAFGSGKMLTGIFNLIYAVSGLTKALLGALGITNALAVSLATVAAMTGAGLLAVGAGIYTHKKLTSDMGVSNEDSFSGMGGGSGQTVINNNSINIEGDANRRTTEKMKDTFSRERGIAEKRPMGSE